jgi:ribosome maturation factor RimP
MTEPDRSLGLHGSALPQGGDGLAPPTTTPTGGASEVLRAAVEPVVVDAGFDLEDLSVVAAGRRRLVRIVIDRDQGVDLDAAAAVSTAISSRLDDGVADQALAGAAYTLEVTSPGVGRPLTLPRHFRRAVGRLVTMTGSDGASRSGRIRRLDGDTLVLLGGSDGLAEFRVPLSEIRRAVVEVEFAPVPAPVAALLAADRDAGAAAGGGRMEHPAAGAAATADGRDAR